MTAQPRSHMTADEFLLWAEWQPGRYELHNGIVYAMTPERSGHAKVKHRVARALERGIEARGCACWMLPNGMTVRVDDQIVYEPDALVSCGPELPDDVAEVPNPVIIVEVLSPATRCIDAAAKLPGYFKIASAEHDVMVDPGNPPLIHHQRVASGEIRTRLVPADAVLRRDPPGLDIAVAALFNQG